MGYTPTSRQYRVYDPARKTVERYSIVRFEEIQKGGTLANSQEGPNDLRIEGEEIEAEDPEPNNIGDTIIVQARTPPQPKAQPEPPGAQPERTEDASEEPAQRLSRSRRAIRLPQRYQANQVICGYGEIVTLKSHEQAITGP